MLTSSSLFRTNNLGKSVDFDVFRVPPRLKSPLQDRCGFHHISSDQCHHATSVRMLHLSPGNIIAFWKMPEMLLKITNKHSRVRFLKQGLSKVRKKSELSKGVNDLKGMTSIGNAGLLHSDCSCSSNRRKERSCLMAESSCLPTVDC